MTLLCSVVSAGHATIRKETEVPMVGSVEPVFPHNSSSPVGAL